MSSWIPSGLLLAAGVTFLASIASAEDGDDFAAIQRLLDAGETGQAEAELRARLAEDPDDGTAWLLLGLAHHQAGRYAEAAEADLTAAARSPRVRATAYYNAACAQALAGDADAAAVTLRTALAEGFLDFDALAADPDLESLRAAGRIGMPAPREYRSMTARNGVRIRYRVELPADHDASRTYPALVSFAPGSGGPRSSDWALEEVWAGEPARRGWIAVHLVAPEDGWINHPSHHALEELLGDLKREHRIEGGKFHLVGFQHGSRPATTYGSMSRAYFRSVTTVANHSFERWDEDEVSRYPQKAFHFLAGERDVRGVSEARRSAELIGGDEVRVVVFEGESVVPASTLAGGLMDYLDENVRRPSS